MARNDEKKLRILLTNICLRDRSGTEMMTADLALALHRRGHEVAIYSPRLGLLAHQLRGLGVPVTDHIEQIGFEADIIHGHHNVVLAVAMVRFPQTPAIFVCHDTSMVYDAPLLSPRVGAYVGVDLACAERLKVDGAPAAAITVIINAVDLARFQCRHDWAPSPRTALAITKQRAPWLPAVRAACRAMDIDLTEVGAGVGRSVSDLPERMLQADLVFAWSRSAAEAAATGAAVVLCDEFGFGGLLTSTEARAFPRTSLGRRGLHPAATRAAVEQAIGAYDPADAALTAEIVRQRLSLDDMAGAYERVYRSVLARRAGSRPADAAKLAAFLEKTIPRFDLPPDLHVEGRALADRLVRLDSWVGGQAQDGGRSFTRPISFAASGLGSALLGPGWSEPEAWGVWSLSRLARLDLPAALAAAWNGELAVDCDHYFPQSDEPDAVRAVEVRLGDRLLARWHFTRSDYGRSNRLLRRLSIPPPLPDEPILPLHFTICAPACPLDGGEASDPRLLGLALREIRGAEAGLLN